MSYMDTILSSTAVNSIDPSDAQSHLEKLSATPDCSDEKYHKYYYRLIPDEQDVIEDTLKTLCDIDHCDLVITTGGTGPAIRDVTPEATTNVCDKVLDGFGELMRATSLKVCQSLPQSVEI